MANHVALTLEANVDQVNDEIKRLEMIMSHDAKILKDGIVSVNFDDIGSRMVEVAQAMIDANGTILSGQMRANVNYKINGNELVLYDTQYYSPFIEYGFNHHGAGFIGPWPFLRPAVNLVAAESTGKIQDTMAMILSGDPFNAGTGNKLQFNNRVSKGTKGTASNLARGLREKYGASGRIVTEKGYKRFNSISQYSNRDEGYI